MEDAGLQGAARTGMRAVDEVPPLGVERARIPEKYRWNLADLYESPRAWAEAREGAIARTREMERFRGRLGESAPALRDGLALYFGLDRDLNRVRSYAARVSDEDLRIGASLERLQSAERAMVAFRAAASFVRPEILAMGPAKVRSLVASEPGLREFAVWIEDLLRWKPHTLDPDAERMGARALDLGDSGEAVRSVLVNADLPRPRVTLGSGERARVDAAAYSRWRASPDRADRVKVFRAFWDGYARFSRTLGAALYAQVKTHVFERDVRGFGSCLEASLFPHAIPADVYRRLIEDVHAALPVLHRYLDLRRRALGLERLGYEDLYAPLAAEIEERYTPERAMELLAGAVAPLGAEYGEIVRKGYEERWVDFLPSPGKRSGAYSETAYGAHPYQLQNFVGLYEDVSTLAHEFGHSVHSWLADRAQPYATREYSTFVAEVASTFNESLLFHHGMRKAEDDPSRLSLLGSRLELMRTTIFRQTLFAEFELAIHETVERGGTLTGENLSDLYLSLVRLYYGHDAGRCRVDERYRVEWAHISHFFWNFYVFQYATSLVASIALSDAILAEASRPGPERPRRDAYLKMLASGASKYPIELLREAGVDMAAPEPFAAAMAHMSRTMDETEEILAKRGKR